MCLMQDVEGKNIWVSNTVMMNSQDWLFQQSLTIV